MNIQKMHRLRFVIPLFVGIFIILSSAILSVWHYYDSKNLTINSTKQSLNIQFYKLKNNLNDLFILERNDLIERQISDLFLDPQMEIFYMTDENGLITHSNLKEYNGTHISKAEKINIEFDKSIGKDFKSVLNYNNDNKYYGLFSVQIGFEVGNIREEKFGVIYFVYDISKIMEASANKNLERVLFSIAFGLLISLILSFILNRLITNRIEDINLVAKEISTGNLNKRVKFKGNDEIALLSANFNFMADSIVEDRNNILINQFIIAHSGDAICLFKSNGYIQFANNSFAELLGYSLEESLKLSVEDIDLSFNKEKWISHWQDLKRLGVINFESSFKDCNNFQIPVEITSNYFLFNNIEFNCAFIRDISERKKSEIELYYAKEKAEENDRLKSAFLKNLSHEIRTPLNGILGFTKLLQEEDLSQSDIFEFSKIINNSGNRLLDMVNSILDISKIETGQMSIYNLNFNLNEFLRNIYDSFIINAKEKRLKLTLNCTLEDMNSVIYTDKSKLNQIITNLISNSIKFTQAGEICFGYYIIDTNIMFYVKDSGIGIQKELQTKIFERFYQVDTSISSGNEGSGLGLAICNGLIKLLNGKIWLESVVNLGTTFYFQIPYANEVVFEIPKDYKIDFNILNQEIKILIAEDDIYSFKYICGLLRNSKFEIIHAKNGEMAVELFKNNPDVKLVLMDLKMPILNGYEALKEIREINPEIPIIAQTAYSFNPEIDNITESGFNDIITKPLKKEKLLSIMCKYL